MKTILSRAFGYLMNVLLLGILLLVLLVRVVPWALDGAAKPILSGSMIPTYQVNDLVVIVPTPAEKINVGDVATYMPRPQDPTLITHRVIEKRVTGENQAVFIFKGDNNPTADRLPVEQKQLAGKVLYSIPKIGVLSTTNPRANGYLIFISAGILFGYAAFLLVKPDNRRGTSSSSSTAQRTPHP